MKVFMYLTIKKQESMYMHKIIKIIIEKILIKLNYINSYFKIKKYDDIIPLGYNCSVAYNINRVHKYLESHIFNWTYIADDNLFLDVLSDLNTIFNDGYIYSKDCNMFVCKRTKILFHCKSLSSDIINENEKIYKKNIENEFFDLNGRTRYLICKFQKILATSESILFVHSLKPFEIKDLQKKINFINNLYILLKNKTKNCNLLIICEKNVYKDLKNKINREIYLREVLKYAPFDDAVNPEKTDIYKYNLIFTEFQPKNKKKSNKKYKYELNCEVV